MTNNKANRLPHLDILRGSAALAVCLYHFTSGNAALLPDNDPVRRAFSLGWLGVQVFFVISGFILPYSMYHRGYKLSDAVSFLARRLKRLEPPYLACIVLVIALQIASAYVPGFRGKPFTPDWAQLAAHAGYLNAFLGYPWLNPVFWTLAIEFQFYIFLALAYPLIVHERQWVRISLVCATALGGLYHDRSLLLQWLPIFAMGMLAFQLTERLLSVSLFTLLMAFVVSMAAALIGVREALAGFATCMAILYFPPRLARLLWPIGFVGVISYSLYLLHTPVCGRVINLVERSSLGVPGRYVAVAVTLGASILAAWLFYLMIEKPSQAWASGKPTKDPAGK